MRFYIFIVLFIFSHSSISEQVDDYSGQCLTELSLEPLASWDFNRDRKFPLKNGIVKFHERRNGIEKIPNTSYFGVKFHYKKKWPDGDAMAELRYDIIEPQDHLFEHIKIYQPQNFYHRLIVEIQPDKPLSIQDWSYGDTVVTNKGDSAKVAKVFDNKLFIKDPSGIYKNSWGKNTTLKNTSNNVTFTSVSSQFYASNNKLSAMWQGSYSNAAMVVETRARSINDYGEHGNGYCSPKGGRSSDHPGFGEQKNFSSLESPAACFDIVDNGSIVELVIERKRATNLENPDGIYRIWKRASNSDWHLIFSNSKIPAYQSEKNYFDKGYIFGWSNSGFREDTDFYLTGWSLWNTIPPFLPAL